MRKLLEWLPLFELIGVAFALLFYATRLQYSEGHHNDFLTHWTLGHLAVTGHGADSYDFATQAALLRRTIPAEKLEWLRAPHIDGVGVSPYPPVMCVLYAPFGLLPPRQAAMAFNVISIGLAVVTGVMISRSVNGRVRSLTCVLAALVHPGLFVSVALAQNALVTLTLWSAGWLFLVRRSDFAAGLIWGLLIYKLHWVVAVGWVPALLGRPRALAGMVTSALTLCAIATAWLGLEAWIRWREQVTVMQAAYHESFFREKLLPLCCDLRGVAARYLPEEFARPFGWLSLALVGSVTVLLYLWRRGWRRNAEADTPAAPMLLFASGLVVPYMFYYDATTFLLPTVALWSYRATFGWAKLALCGLLTLGYFCGVAALSEYSLLPWPTMAVIGLWIVSLTVSAKTTGVE